LSGVDAAFLLGTQALLALALHSVYKTASREAEFVRNDSSQTLNPPKVILERFRTMVEQRDIAITVLLISILAAVSWIVGVVTLGDQLVSSWGLLSLGLIYGLVLFLAIETLYLLSSKWLAPSMRNNRLFVRAIDSVALTGSLLVALAATLGTITTVGCSTVLSQLPCQFWDSLSFLSAAILLIVFFVSGLGTMGLVDTITESVSSRVPSGRMRHALYLVLLFGSMAGLITLLPYNPVFGPATAFGELGAELAILIGISYLSYLLVRKRESQQSSSLVYVILMLGLSGLFLAYIFRNTAPPPDFSQPNPFPPPSLEQLVLALTLFSVAYLTLLLALPRALEHKLGIKQSKLVATVTFLMLFAVVANYQLAHLAGFGLGALFFQEEGAVYPGVWVGALVLTVRKIKQSHERGRLRKDSIVPFCTNCGKRLDANSKFCWACGSPVPPPQPERVLFVGDATQIASIKERHSTKRKIGSLIAGGPMGYLAFGMDFPLKRVLEGQVAVTSRAVYFGGNFYPFKRLVQIKPGHYSNSVVLSVKRFPEGSLQKTHVGTMDAPVDEVELKSSNVKALTHSIEQAAAVDV